MNSRIVLLHKITFYKFLTLIIVCPSFPAAPPATITVVLFIYFPTSTTVQNDVSMYHMRNVCSTFHVGSIQVVVTWAFELLIFIKCTSYALQNRGETETKKTTKILLMCSPVFKISTLKRCRSTEQKMWSRTCVYLTEFPHFGGCVNCITKLACTKSSLNSSERCEVSFPYCRLADSGPNSPFNTD